MPIDDDLVPNPRYQDLQTALTAVREHLHVLETALDQACATFAGNPVWVGPTARAFGEELHERRARIRTTAHRVLAELEAELRATPRTVAKSAAAAMGGWS
ncbi:hypothetical protein Pth03_29880 [Planotetraspora thailandica]|uniref:Uncharacterized protein n=1 Tax=Planotetraspora thailandica TaxID=487172 RepID=A0A8J3V5W9_9ACTN|nr:hypothetical protein [Planotetraspora thailandica]GII54599.1 hypothetical protein Pth03_29880 [Planotetraspora thailandica]